jgi:hypothetical protein
MLVTLWAEEEVEEVMLPKELVDHLLDQQDSDDEDDPFMPRSEGQLPLKSLVVQLADSDSAFHQ